MKLILKKQSSLAIVPFLLPCCLIHIITLCFSNCVLAKDSKQDSLWNVWNNISLSDSVRLDAIDIIANKITLYKNPDSSYSLAKMQYSLALKKGVKYHIIKALNTQGIAQVLKGNYPKAIDYHTRSFEMSKSERDTIGLINSMNNIGLIYKYQNNFDQATDFFNQTLNLSKLINHKQGIGASYNNMGFVFFSLEKYDQALNYFSQGLAINRELENKQGIAGGLTNIAIIHAHQENYHKAHDFLTESLKIFEKLDDRRGIAAALNNIGTVYCTNKHYSKALNYFKQSLQISEKNGFQVEVKDVTGSLYVIHKNLGNYQKSLEMYETHIEVRDSLQSIEEQKKVLNTTLKYEYKQKAVKDSLELVRENELNILEVKFEQAKKARERIIIFIIILVVLIILGASLLIRNIQNKNEKKHLVQQIKLIKAESIAQIRFSNESSLPLITELNKEKIESFIGYPLNATDWKILNTLLNNPIITNKEIAREIHLSVDGVRSSLKKMYLLFGVKAKQNGEQRLSIIVKAIDISHNK